MAFGVCRTTAPVRVLLAQPAPICRQVYVVNIAAGKAADASGVGGARATGAAPRPADVREIGAARKPEDAYEIGEVLGSGSFGTVHRARDRRTGNECALKIVERSAVADQVNPDREVQLHTALAHPNIVRVYDAFADMARVQVVLEICHGGELRDALDKHPAACSEAEAQHIFKQIMHAVCYMHGQGIAHRDLKLENFLVKEQDASLATCTVKLIDFGFAARFTPGEAALRTVCGSPAYVAPEMLSGRPYDERCDVWSCGIMLYYLLSRQMPFAGNTFDDIIQNVTRQPLGFPTQPWRGISRKARDLIGRMCCRDVQRRYSAEQAGDSSWLQVDEVLALVPSFLQQGLQEDHLQMLANAGA